ncbi:nuclease [Candidatus Falkowbacteria bacterium]|jgi:micrococcal nuclease|nr:nuclease [Candidatus Falkowbacteria bacterium]MBT4432891.1 nuclease [Candidatus Falkowbacteria bacterium]
MKISKITIVIGIVLSFLAGFLLQIIDLSKSDFDEEILEIGKVEFVIDGDTFILSDNRKVRLIGVDAPEKDEFLYEESKQLLKFLVEGKTVKLEKEVMETDRYGRLLRHVFIDNIWVNKTLLDEGLARVMTIPPDNFSAVFLEKAESKAKDNKKGLWK